MYKKFFLILISILIITPLSSDAQGRRMRKANKYYQAGEYFEAQELYIKVYSKAKKKEEKAEVSFKIGMCARKLMDPQKSIIWFRRALLYKYQDPISNLYLADAYKMRGLYEEAKEYYANYKDLVPSDPRGEKGMKSCDLAIEWKENPSRFIINDINDLNSRQNDFAPALCADTNIIYFTSTRNSTQGNLFNNNSGQNFADIFVAQKDTRGYWSEPVPVEGEINSEYDDGSCELVKDGRTMYYTFCPVIEDVDAGCKIFKSDLSGEKWSAPQIVKTFSDTAISCGQPALSPDELTMYFISDNPKGIGGKDIWKMTRNSVNASWGAPQNLGEDINTKYDELYPSVDNENNLYFATAGRVGMGGLDIFKASKNEDDNWKVENLKYPINTEANDFGIVFYQKDDSRGYFSSGRNTGKGDDIYSFYLKPLLVTLKGFVINDKNHAYLPDVDVEITGSDGSVTKVKTDEVGAFETKLLANVDYMIIASKKTFLKANGSVSTKGVEEDGKVFETEIYMKPGIGIVSIPNIRYDFNDTTLREESKVALDELIEMLTINPTVRIELRANTDYRGSEKSNQILSQGRANSVVEYLVENGIKKDRLVAKGYGESIPLKVSKLTAQKYPFLQEGDVLDEQFINSLETEEQKEICHELNRRTEFQVLDMNYGENYETFGDN